MKGLFLILSLIIALACSSSKSQISNENSLKENQSRIIVFEYQAITRGSFLLIVMTNNGEYVTVSRDPNATPSKQSYSTEKWLTITQEMDKLDLEDLQNIVAPSNDHRFDGALIGTLKIIVDNKEYKTMFFDHGNPPEEIKEIVKILLSFSEKE